MLGELYKPRGLARETAQVVLEVKEPYACNVALYCSNECAYCYVPHFMRKARNSCTKVRHPKSPPNILVDDQLSRGKLGELPQGVFISFLTDPFLDENMWDTEDLIELLILDYNINVATSSKVGVSLLSNVRHGMTVVSLDEKFWKQYERNALPPKDRIRLLEDRGYVWVSMEPYPPSAIWKQNINDLLEEIKFVNLIIFGKWNYDPRSKTEEARKEYADNIFTVRDFTKSNGIRLHIKSDTLKFTGVVL